MMLKYLPVLMDKIRFLIQKQPLTLFGMLYPAMMALFFYFLAIREVDLVMVVIGALGILFYLFVFMLVMGYFALAFLILRRKVEDIHFVLNVSETLKSGFNLNLWRIPWLRFEWTWDIPGADVRIERENRRWHEYVRCGRRGKYEGFCREFIFFDIFGWFRISFKRRVENPVTIYPAKLKFSHMETIYSLTHGDMLSHPAGRPQGDRVDLRQYTGSDSLRMILWKVYARSRNLYVRVPEQALSYSKKACLYLVTGSDDEASAGFCRGLIEQRLLGSDWLFGTTGVHEPIRELAPALEALAQSGNTRKFAPEFLSVFIRKAVRQGADSFLIMLPGDPEEWQNKLGFLAMYPYTFIFGALISPPPPTSDIFTAFLKRWTPFRPTLHSKPNASYQGLRGPNRRLFYYQLIQGVVHPARGAD